MRVKEAFMLGLSRNLLAAVLFAAVITPALPALAQAKIAWRVENPFRLFADPVDTARHRATYAALTSQEKAEPVLAIERQLAKRHPDGWAAALSGEVCWDGTRNRYGCSPDDAEFATPKAHQIEARLQDRAELGEATCTWLTAPKGRERERGLAVTQPCAEPIVLEVPYPDGADVTVEVDGKVVAAEVVRVRDLLVVGIGDSFASGEGNPDVPVRFSRERTADYGSPREDVELTGYPARIGDWREIGDDKFIEHNARWLDQACHRSLYSHQLRAALQLAIEDPHRAVTFVGFACSGAEVTKGLFLRYKGNEWVPNPPDVSQISAVARAQCGRHAAPLRDFPEAYHMRGRIPDLVGGLSLHKCAREHARKIDLLLVSVGGNDIGFSRLVANAVLNDQSLLKRLGGWFGQVYDTTDTSAPLENLDARYKALHRAFHNILHVPWDESDRIILTAYPPLALLEDGRSPCPTGRIGMDVLPAFALDAVRVREGEDISEKLLTVMRQHARGRGWTFAEGHRRAFLGHGICAGYRTSSFKMADDLRLPRHLNGYWSPYNPAEFRAYARRQRWFRTPNDAFMTGNFHVTGTLLQSVLQTDSLKWTQLLLASTYSGAFHPTAEGQAVIADAVVRSARTVLERYSPSARSD